MVVEGLQLQIRFLCKAAFVSDVCAHRIWSAISITWIWTYFFFEQRIWTYWQDMLAMPWPRCSPQNCGCQNYIPILHEHDGRFPDCWCALQSQAKCVLLCFLRLSLNMGAFPSPCFVGFFLMRTDWFMWNHCMIHAKSLRSKCALRREACDAMQRSSTTGWSKNWKWSSRYTQYW
jgi:hypothetical protein